MKSIQSLLAGAFLAILASMSPTLSADCGCGCPNYNYYDQGCGCQSAPSCNQCVQLPCNQQCCGIQNNSPTCNWTPGLNQCYGPCQAGPSQCDMMRQQGQMAPQGQMIQTRQYSSQGGQPIQPQAQYDQRTQGQYDQGTQGYRYYQGQRSDNQQNMQNKQDRSAQSEQYSTTNTTKEKNR